MKQAGTVAPVPFGYMAAMLEDIPVDEPIAEDKELRQMFNRCLEEIATLSAASRECPGCAGAGCARCALLLKEERLVSKPTLHLAGKSSPLLRPEDPFAEDRAAARGIWIDGPLIEEELNPQYVMPAEFSWDLAEPAAAPARA